MQIFREFPSIQFFATFPLQFLQAFNSVECCCFLSGLAACDTAHGREREESEAGLAGPDSCLCKGAIISAINAEHGDLAGPGGESRPRPVAGRMPHRASLRLHAKRQLAPRRLGKRQHASRESQTTAAREFLCLDKKMTAGRLDPHCIITRRAAPCRRVAAQNHTVSPAKVSAARPTPDCHVSTDRVESYTRAESVESKDSPRRLASL